MPLWSPNDPYGVAILRKILLALTVFLIFFGIYRSTVRGDPLVVYLVASGLALVVGLFVEKAIGWVRRA